jgi:hypothetical protein
MRSFTSSIGKMFDRLQKLPTLVIFIVLIAIIAGVSIFGPPEQSLGEHVRLVYLHGAWVWTAIAGFLAAAVAGFVAMLKQSLNLDSWSIALNRAGLFFWITYLPITLVTARFNWNGLFLEEPRWRMALDLAIVGVLFQLAILVIRRAYVGSAISVGYLLILIWSLMTTDQILHPRGPIATSNSSTIQLFFGVLTMLTIVSGIFLTFWFRNKVPAHS